MVIKLANNCMYDMKIAGSRNSINEVVAIMNYKSLNCRMYRIFKAEVAEQEDDYAIISGDCAWSVDNCMINVPDGATSLIQLSKLFRLDFEVFSCEPGCAFQEHYVIQNGNIVCDECVDYQEYWFNEDDWEGSTSEERFKNFCEEYDLNITIDDLDGDVYVTGGLPNYCEWEI